MPNDDFADDDEQNNPDQKSAAGAGADGRLYSFDSPSTIPSFYAARKVAFVTFRTNFFEWVRIKPRSSGDFAHVFGNTIQGSRASNLVPWYHAHHLVWNGTAFVPDANTATASGSYYTGGAGRMGSMTVEAVGNPPTEGITATFNGTGWTVTLASGASNVIPQATGTTEFTVQGAIQYRVTIAQAAGGVAFAAGDKFTASVYRTARQGGKVTALDEGALADVNTD